MIVEHHLSKTAWEDFDSKIRGLIESRGCRRVCEIGAGANPLLPLSYINEHHLEYALLDVSAEELQKAPDGYRKIVCDITSINVESEVGGTFDLIFSKMLAEHVPDGEVFHRNVYLLLSERGTAFHFFPTLYAPPFVLNKFLPEDVAYRIVDALHGKGSRKKEGRHAKFPAYYSWCLGPSRTQYNRFSSLGYVIRRYTAFYGHDGYYHRVKAVQRLHVSLAAVLCRLRLSALSSYAWVELEK